MAARINLQLKHRDSGQIDGIVLNLDGRAAGAEPPLLTNHLSSLILRRTREHGKLLRPLLPLFAKFQADSVNGLRLIEVQANHLRSGIGSPPATCPLLERILNRMLSVFR